FREPSSRNWLGDKVPFPLNPSFKPPTPLSDAFRSQLFRAYTVDPNTNSIRTLAARHNTSIKRVNAILRLKRVEEEWKKNKPLQTGFTKGMEDLLGVTDATRRMEAEPDGDTPIQYYHTGQNDQETTRDRYNVEEADMQDQVEGKHMARRQYQATFWESVTEGEEPVMPTILEATRPSTRASAKHKQITYTERGAGRPAVKFIDVGDAFVDEKEKERREREGARRSALKARKR
ncbi:eukaryotic mitochondrial regulator protein-domain-containing protein, partial [Melanogaster broomeanus]